jgi:hypothetical protein
MINNIIYKMGNSSPCCKKDDPEIPSINIKDVCNDLTCKSKCLSSCCIKTEKKHHHHHHHKKELTS